METKQPNFPPIIIGDFEDETNRDLANTLVDQETANHFDVKFNSVPQSDWTSYDWINWHKSLVKAFESGMFKSKIKYKPEKALELSNGVFLTWWNKNQHSVIAWFKKGFFGYDSDFYDYFTNVGLNDIFSVLQAVVTPTEKHIVNTVQNVGSAVEGVSGGISFIGKNIVWIVLILVVVAAAFFYFTRIKKGGV